MKKLLLLFLLICYSPVFSQWQEFSTGDTNALYSISAVNDNIIWACTNYKVVVKSTNGGANWSVYRNVPATSTYFAMTNIFAMDEYTAFVSGSHIVYDTGICYKTTNGGLNWTRVLTVANGFFNALWMKNSNEGIITGDPVNNYWKIYKTTNGGSNWFESYSLYQSSPEYGIMNSMYSINDYVWIGTNLGRIFFSSNFGTNWTIQNTNNSSNEIDAIYFVNPQSGFCAGISTFRYTTNYGTNWITMNNPTSTFSVGIAGNFNELIAGSSGRQIYKTTNLGTSWNLEYALPTGITRNHLTKARSGGTIWDARSNGKIGKRINPIKVKQISSVVPDNFALEQNYPNPFNPATNIKYRVTNNIFVNLKVYNILGKEIAILVNEKQTPGTYEVVFDASALPSGVYFYRLTAGDFVQTRKLTLLK